MTAEAPQQPKAAAPNLRAEAMKAARAKTEFILSRAWGLLRNPRAEWDQIKAENTTIFQVLLGYVLPLAAVFAIATLLGAFIFGERMGSEVVRPELGPMLVTTVVTTVFMTVGIGALGFLASAIAENFDAERNDVQGVKLVAYSFTPALVAGVFNFLPMLSVPAVVLGLAGSAFVMYRGIPVMMRAPEDEAQNYTATIMVLGLVVILILALLSYCTTGG